MPMQLIERQVRSSAITDADAASHNNEVSARLSALVQTHEVRFRIGDAFRADDTVGHFVIALAAAMNDLLLQNTLILPPDNPNRADLTLNPPS